MKNWLRFLGSDDFQSTTPASIKTKSNYNEKKQELEKRLREGEWNYQVIRSNVEVVEKALHEQNMFVLVR